jgi:hypothetical protein
MQNVFLIYPAPTFSREKPLRTLSPSKICGDSPNDVQCPGGCCPDLGVSAVCCDDNLYCGKTEADCPDFKPLSEMRNRDSERYMNESKMEI